jgi:hypothetical protein
MGASSGQRSRTAPPNVPAAPPAPPLPPAAPSGCPSGISQPLPTTAAAVTRPIAWTNRMQRLRPESGTSPVPRRKFRRAPRVTRAAPRRSDQRGQCRGHAHALLDLLDRVAYERRMKPRAKRRGPTFPIREPRALLCRDLDRQAEQRQFRAECCRELDRGLEARVRSIDGRRTALAIAARHATPPAATTDFLPTSHMVRVRPRRVTASTSGAPSASRPRAPATESPGPSTFRLSWAPESLKNRVAGA